jgi:hypothetical protein
LGTTVERNGSDTRNAVERNGSNLRWEGAQSEGRISSAIERNGSDTRNIVNSTSADIRLETSQTEGRLGTAIERNGSDTRTLVQAGNHEIHSTVEARTAELRGLATTNAIAAALEAERLKSCITMQAAENAAGLHRSVAESKYELARQLAECCCEQKELTMREAAATRGLIEKNTIDALREALEQSRRENDRHAHHESVRLSVQNVMAQQTHAYGYGPGHYGYGHGHDNHHGGHNG